MSDQLDQAQAFEEFRRDLALRAARAGVPQLATPSGFGLCDDCGDPIERERIVVVPGCKRCLTCQEAFERLARTHAR